ncbi:hypothetical protein IAU59_007602 [Kwoniella sp. CBS 9459]
MNLDQEEWDTDRRTQHTSNLTSSNTAPPIKEDRSENEPPDLDCQAPAAEIPAIPAKESSLARFIRERKEGVPIFSQAFRKPKALAGWLRDLTSRLPRSDGDSHIPPESRLIASAASAASPLRPTSTTTVASSSPRGVLPPEVSPNEASSSIDSEIAVDDEAPTSFPDRFVQPRLDDESDQFFCPLPSPIPEDTTLSPAYHTGRIDPSMGQDSGYDFPQGQEVDIQMRSPSPLGRRARGGRLRRTRSPPPDPSYVNQRDAEVASFWESLTKADAKARCKTYNWSTKGFEEGWRCRAEGRVADAGEVCTECRGSPGDWRVGCYRSMRSGGGKKCAECRVRKRKCSFNEREPQNALQPPPPPPPPPLNITYASYAYSPPHPGLYSPAHPYTPPARVPPTKATSGTRPRTSEPITRPPSSLRSSSPTLPLSAKGKKRARALSDSPPAAQYSRLEARKRRE